MDHSLHQHAATGASDGFFNNLLKVYVPRYQCMYHESGLIWLHIVSDFLIAAAYYSIPVALIYFARRRKDLSFNWMFLLFAFFILLCGTTHVFGIIAIWQPFYRLDGIVKLATGIISVGTSILLWRLMPAALALPSLEEMTRRKEELEVLVAERTNELQSTNDKLRESEEKFRTIADSIPQLAWMTDGADGNASISWYNKRWYEYTGLTPEQCIGQGWQQLHDPAILPRVLAKFKDAVTKGIPWEDTFPLRRHDGQMRWHLSRAMPVRNEDGKIVRWFGTNTDITDQLKVEEDLRIAKEKAEAASTAKSEFLANMSHEIRTPMNAIVGLTELMRRGDVPSEKQQIFLDTMASSANQLMGLINDLLDISKIESRQLHIEAAPFRLARLIDEVASMNAVQADKKGIRLTSDNRCDGSIEVVGDALRIKQVLMNVTSNAVKFTEKGEVKVSSRCTPSPDGRSVDIIVEVSDTGIGIPEDKQESIFGKFVQADAAINRKYGGTGLGLSIARTLIEVMGGSIKVRSRPGEGATFTISLSLPAYVRTAGQSPANADAPANQARRPRGKVLLVEDNDANLLVATSALDAFGYEYRLARNGQEALDVLEAEPFDIVLMDVQMPVMDGCTATRIFRQREKASSRKTPIIGVTAYALKGDRDRCVDAGMNHYLAKPFSTDDLRAVLEKYAVARR